jgi:hypothetical protein
VQPHANELSENMHCRYGRAYRPRGVHRIYATTIPEMVRWRRDSSVRVQTYCGRATTPPCEKSRRSPFLSVTTSRAGDSGFLALQGMRSSVNQNAGSKNVRQCVQPSHARPRILCSWEMQKIEGALDDPGLLALLCGLPLGSGNRDLFHARRTQ